MRHFLSLPSLHIFFISLSLHHSFNFLLYSVHSPATSTLIKPPCCVIFKCVYRSWGVLLHMWKTNIKPFVAPEETACNLINWTAGLVMDSLKNKSPKLIMQNGDIAVYSTQSSSFQKLMPALPIMQFTHCQSDITGGNSSDLFDILGLIWFMSCHKSSPLVLVSALPSL